MDILEKHLHKISCDYYQSYYSERNLRKVPTRHVVTDGRQRPTFNDDPFYCAHEDEIIVEIEMTNHETRFKTVQFNRTSFNDFRKILAQLLAKDGIDVKFSVDQKIQLSDSSGTTVLVEIFDKGELPKYEQQILFEIYDNIWRSKWQSKNYDFNGFLNFR